MRLGQGETARPTTRLRALIAEHRPLIVPGCFNAMSARILENAGFPALYMSGYGTSLNLLGLPDAGLATLTEMALNARLIASAVRVPLIADADTGFGNAINVVRTVEEYIRGGVAGLHLEDQVAPKRCGHVAGREVIGREEAVLKVRAAARTRDALDPDFVLIARTDARGGHGFDEAVSRGRAYAEAGADIVFVESLHSEDEMRRACAAIDAPMIANMSDGGKTPIRSAQQLAEFGYQLAIFPAMNALAACAAMEKALRNLKANGTSLSNDVPLFGFDDFCRMVGFEDVWAFEEKWKDVLEQKPKKAS